MTQREFNTAVINANISDEITAFAIASNDKMDKANAKKAEKIAEKNAAEQPLYDELVACLTEDPQTASDLAAQVDGINTVQKASAMLRKLAAKGIAVQTEVKVDKGRTAKAYALA